MRQTRGFIAAITSFLAMFSICASAQEAVPPVAKIAQVTGNQQEVTRQFFGHVVAKETVDLAFQVGGQIVELPIVEGEIVEKGGLVASLDLEPFELAHDQARVQFQQANRNFERFQRLQGNTVSQVSLDDAETQLKLSEIAVREAARSLRNAKLAAPFDALVASRNVANFTTISAGTPIARLHDMSEIRIEIDVPEVLFQRTGEDADVGLVAQFPSSDEQYPLQVREFNAETSQVGQTFQITLGMAPPENLVVFPGSSVTVFATLQNPEPGRKIPSSAVLTANDGSTQVMVFSPTGADEGTVSLTTVKVTPGSRGEVIVADGLEDGQEIIASGVNLLSDGDRVRRFTGFSN